MYSTDLYPSRIGGEEQILSRQDPVLYAPNRQQGPLRAQELQQFEQEGWLMLPEYLPEWVRPLNRDIPRLKEALQEQEVLITEPDSGELRSIFEPHKHSKIVRRFFEHPKIVAIVEQLLGSPTYLMQSRINVKPAYHGRSFAWHSDFETWHVEDGLPRMRTLTAWIMLNDNEVYNGPLYVIPGSHKLFISCAGTTQTDNHKQSLKEQKSGVPQRHTMEQILQKHPIQVITGKAGTVVFHECNLLHGSPDNISHRPRSLLMGVYNSVHNQPGRPFSGLPPRPDFLCHRQPDEIRPHPYH